jgi:hypothetical protein
VPTVTNPASWAPPGATRIPAAPSAQRGRRHVGRWILIMFAILIGISVGVSAGNTKHTTTTQSTTEAKSTVSSISQGLGARDASADVGTPIMAPPDSIGFQEITAPVTNHSSQRSNYWITAAIESADGSIQYDTVTMSVRGLEPGQTGTAKGMGSAAPAGARVRITQVERLASS